MAKTLGFTYKGVEYTLEFTRKTVARMEQDGFAISEIGERPMTLLPELFAGAFKANHPFVRKELVDEIFGKFTNKSELIAKLAEMYNEPIAALVEEPEEDEGNIAWTLNW